MNPVGRGVATRSADLVDQPAPCIEDPKAPLSAGKRSAPAGFGSIASHWDPRRSYFGTFDEDWQKTRMPLMPRDFDPRSQQVAHPCLQLDQAPLPGDPIATRGLTEPEDWITHFRTVSLSLVGKKNDGSVLTARPVADTMLLEPERDQVVLVFRQAFKKGRGKSLLREIVVDADDA
jgi:hypothetical protein